MAFELGSITELPGSDGSLFGDGCAGREESLFSPNVVWSYRVLTGVLSGAKVPVEKCGYQRILRVMCVELSGWSRSEVWAEWLP
jgi:hypothetical protein